jgi:hypothetical protein
MTAKFGYIFVLLASFELGGCGAGVPEMNPLFPDQNIADDKGNLTQNSTQGAFEADLVRHIKCSIEKGLMRVGGYLDPVRAPVGYVPWLFKWGTSINLTLQVDEISSANPGVGTTNQWGNEFKSLPHLTQPVVYPQEFLFGIGATGSVHSTRVETIQLTYPNTWLLADARLRERRGQACEENMGGFLIQSNLKIDEFIWDKATIASQDPTSASPDFAIFNTFQDTLTFVVSYGGNVTPTWKIETVVAGTNSPLLSATRTGTDTLIVTLGPLDNTTGTNPLTPLALTGGASQQHQAASIGAAVGASNSSQIH